MEKINRCKQKFALGIIVLITLLLALYLGLAFFFQTHFFYRTTIDGLSCSMQDVESVKEQIDKKTQTYELHVIGREDMEEIITAEDVLLKVEVEAALRKLLSEQNVFLWPSSIWTQRTYQLEHIGQIDEEALQILLKNKPFMQHEYMKKPQNAYIGVYQESTGKYDLVEAYKGTFVNKKKVFSCIKQALENMQGVLNLEDTGCYIEPAVTSKNKKLLQAWTNMNKMVSAKITYIFGEQEEVVDASLIQNWVIHVNNRVYLNEDEVEEYIKNLSRTYDTAYRRHAFITAEGQNITIDSGFYGWRMNREEERKELIQLITEGTVEEREPIYLQRGASHGEYDYGDTYVEINLTKQHLYFWENGNIIIESDFVSGNVSRGMGTPEGIFPITYKERNAVLKGTNYSTPVSYWMPFNGGIGMHDASWRKEFGGTIYETNGSHGCINLPLEVAKEIYDHVEAGMPVICYYE